MAVTEVATQTITSITDAFAQAAYTVISYLPTLIAAIIILLVGWIVGRLLGKFVSKILDKIGVDDALRKTGVGKAVENSGMEIVHLFDLVVRWFVYLIAILAAANILQLEILTDLFNSIVLYLPHIGMFLIILVGGFILIDYFADTVQQWGKSKEIEFFGAIVLFLRVFFYFIVLILALTQLLIDLTIIYIFLVPIAWGVGIGVGVGIAAFLVFGMKDRAPEMLDDILGKFSK